MHLKTTFILVCLFIIQINSLSARDYWGLRNISTRIPDRAYSEFDADYMAYPVSWARTELEDDQFTWQALDNSLDFAERFGATVVLLVSCSNGWATGGAIQAPTDINRRPPLSEDPPEHGYSEFLYDFAANLIDHIAEREHPVVRYLRFVNEPEYNWTMETGLMSGSVQGSQHRWWLCVVLLIAEKVMQRSSCYWGVRMRKLKSLAEFTMPKITCRES